jgi:AraC-like DNA-binding protein
LALSSLRREDVDIGQLALRLGYQSQSAFNRAFKRYIGTAPGAARSGTEMDQRAARANQSAMASAAVPIRVGSS